MSDDSKDVAKQIAKEVAKSNKPKLSLNHLFILPHQLDQRFGTR